MTTPLFSEYRTYVVNVVCAVILDRHGSWHTLYRGNVVPSTASPEHVERLLADGTVIEMTTP